MNSSLRQFAYVITTCTCIDINSIYICTYVHNIYSYIYRISASAICISRAREWICDLSEMLIKSDDMADIAVYMQYASMSAVYCAILHAQGAWQGTRGGTRNLKFENFRAASDAADACCKFNFHWGFLLMFLTNNKIKMKRKKVNLH